MPLSETLTIDLRPLLPLELWHASLIAAPWIDETTAFEALIPMGLVGVMFFVTGTGYSALARARNDGKPLRHSIDTFEENMMRRDERLTGSRRGQSTDPIAPKEFATNSVWNTERVQNQ